MSELVPLSQIGAAIAPNLVSVRNWADASFVSLPIVYPSGSFVTVRLTYAHGTLIRVSDAGFAYREAESFGATRSFANTARGVAETFDVEIGKRSIYVEVPPEEVERAIFDVSAASNAVAERIVSGVAGEGEAAISDALHEKLESLFPKHVEHEGKVIGASSTEWDVTAVARLSNLSNLITSQDYINDEIVAAKRVAQDYAILVSPEFEFEGASYRVLLDGHHSLAAAIADGAEPDVTEANATLSDNVGLLSDGKIEDFLGRVDRDRQARSGATRPRADERRKPRPCMTGSDLIRWREHMGLNKVEGAKALDLSRTTLQRYEDDASPIPRYIALACAALIRRLKPWPQ